MSLSSILGIDASVDKTQAAVAKLLDEKVGPLVDEIENRLEGIISSNLDRLNGATITIPEIKITVSIPSEPKATPAA